MFIFAFTMRIIPAILFIYMGMYVLFCGPFQGAGLIVIPISLFCFAAGIAFIIPEILYYRKTATEIWKKWDDVHHSNKQQERIDKAMNGDVTPKKIYPKSKCATFVGYQGNYQTTLLRCSCPDFKKRRVPCKHMYYLAYELNVL